MESPRFRAGDRIMVYNRLATVCADGALGSLSVYLRKNRLPFRWDHFDYGKDENCHSHVPIDYIRHLTPLEKLL